MQEIIIGKDRASVGELIGRGGEGEVYAIKGRSTQAVKIYNADLRSKRESKITAMVSEGLALKTDLIAYPGEVVTDPKGNFLGFVMRLVSGYQPLHELYSPKSRIRHFPKADYRFLVHSALNIARAVGKAHQTGSVIGDLNESGILIAPDGTAALIDADSFQVKVNGVFYPCVVGKEGYTPPELFGKNLSTIERSIEHDAFSLAVAIFHLLFMGKHPYAGVRNGADTSMGQDIANNRFAYSLLRRAQTQTEPPPGALTLDLFPHLVSQAFEEAFGLSPNARPDASGWIHALSKLEGSLNRCSKVRTHYYPNAAKGCVWCKLAAKSGLDMFPDLSAVSPNIPTDARDTEQAIREILAFRFPAVDDFLPAITIRSASFALIKAKRSERRRTFLGVLMMGGAVAGFLYAAPAWFLWIALAFWGWSFVGDREVSARPFEQAFKVADGQVQHALDAFLQRNGLPEVIKARGDLDATIAAYKGHDNALNREVMKLKSNREARQRRSYLDRFSVRRANLSGFGPAKTATLISFGIETAADVNRSAVMQVPGFGDAMTDKLMAWRSRHEARFKYNRTPNAQDVADERVLRGRFAAEKARLEATIGDGLRTLQNARLKFESLPSRAKSDRALSDALAKRAQAERDLIELGVGVPTSRVAITITSPARPAPQPPKGPPPRAKITLGAGTPSCPKCGSGMRRRTGPYGQFWGCSKYPKCRGTRN